jgi:uncharacterized protein YdhG (YjbR/CyaY superfamily)
LARAPPREPREQGGTSGYVEVPTASQVAARARLTPPRCRRCIISCMRKLPSRTRGVAAKTHRAAKSVEAYLAAVPEPARSTLQNVRAVIRSVVPAKAIEVISYGMPAFKNQKSIVWYAAFSDHCSLFPTSSVINRLKKELEGYTVSKGTIQFALDKPMPAALLKIIVKARLADIEKQTLRSALAEKKKKKRIRAVAG